MIDLYLKEPERTPPDSLNGIYLQLLKSAQNAQSKTAVIGKALGERKVEHLGSVLGNFNPIFVKSEFNSCQDLFNQIQNQLNPRGKMRSGPKSIWPKYCKTISDGATFLANYGSAEEFYRCIDPFAEDEDPRVHLALPLMISKSIEGIGYALACDFLKSLGYKNYGKPDVHIRDILIGLGICESKDKAYDVALALNRLARKSRVTPYTLDKALWLIGSGKFNKHKDTIGKDGQLPRMKAEFITFVKKRYKPTSS
ncbi:MAG: hypothetical protein QHH14_14610 [Clostridiales bacterium]|nr:hypothetical protein [Clostridiales bacterium]